MPFAALRMNVPAGGGGTGFPVVLSVTPTDLGGADVTIHNVNRPAVNSGDLLIYLGGTDGSATCTTAASGVNPLVTGTPNQIRLSTFYEIAPSSAAATTVAFTTSLAERSEWQVYRIQAGTFQSVPEAAAVVTNNAGTTTPDPPNVAASWGSASNLFIAVMACDNTRTISVYPLPNNQTRTANAGSGTAYVTLGSCSNDVSAGSLDPGTFTISTSSAWATTTIAVRPI